MSVNAERPTLNAIIAELRSEVARLKDTIRCLTSERVPNWPPPAQKPPPVIDPEYLKELIES